MSQGKTSIPGLDDGEEFRLTDVSPEYKTTGSSHSFMLSLLSSALCLLRLRLSLAQIMRVYVRSWLGVYRNNDAKQPHVGLSPH